MENLKRKRGNFTYYMVGQSIAAGVCYYETTLHGRTVNSCVRYYKTILHGGTVDSCVGYIGPYYMGGQSIAV